MTKLNVLLSIAIGLVMAVILLGAYTRLSHAGLGCPDWPACYGKILVSNITEQDQQAYLNSTFEANKAWIEMLHRYMAATLGVLVFVISALILYQQRLGSSAKIAFALSLLVIGQALLGRWTVTLKLLPIVVSSHLLGGLAILAGLWWLLLRSHYPGSLQRTSLYDPTSIALIIIIIQIFLGAWLSSNYAGIACIGFPKCNGQWLPDLDWQGAFQWLNQIGLNHQGGRLEGGARITIHMVHRFAAFITVLYVGALSLLISIRRPQRKALTISAIATLFLLIGQFVLGILNVLYLLPLPLALAHNGVAATLLLAILSLVYFSNLASK